MKTSLPLILSCLILTQTYLYSQSEVQLERYLKRYPQADKNQDGTLSKQEARAHRNNNERPQENDDPSTGDNLASISEIPGIDISESISPVLEVTLESTNGVDLSFVYRKPIGNGPFKTILFFHGGGGQSNQQALKKSLLNGAIQTRFLNEGYLTITATRRPYWKTKDNSPSGFYDAVDDATLIVETAKALPNVDPSKVVLYGGSGGGILAIVTASKTELASVIAGEPATVIPLHPMTGLEASSADYRSIMEAPHEKFTELRKTEIHEWMRNIQCPILVLQGEPVGLYKTNFEILIPEMQKLGKDITSISYPGVTHGFYWGTVKTGATLKTVETIMEDVTSFIDTHAR